jgi:transposase-like protein
MKQTPVKVRRKFDEAFKREAVNNWRNSGKSAETVGQELGLGANLLYSWKQALAPADAGGRAAAGAKAGSVAYLQEQLNGAQREVRHLREQCTILKKTLGILSEPAPNAMNGSIR